MAGSIKAVKIGVIAEEKNDVDTIYELTRKIIKENRFSFTHFIGHGCGKLRKKCRAWADNLFDRGCTHLIVVHDLDKNDEKNLRTMLGNEIKDVKFKRTIILIPIEELDAWLLCDAEALKATFNMKKITKVPKSPEKIASPKEYLGELINKNSKAQYLNTVHNRRIAGNITIKSLVKCSSFSPFPVFLRLAVPDVTAHLNS